MNGLRVEIRKRVRTVQTNKGRFQTLREAYQCAKRAENIEREEQQANKAVQVMNTEGDQCHEKKEELLRLQRELQVAKEQVASQRVKLG